MGHRHSQSAAEPDLLQTAGGLSPWRKKKLSKTRADGDLMSAYERYLVATTWEGIDDKEAVVRKIFLRLFESKPELKQLFPFRHTASSKLEADPQLTTHARMIVSEFQNAVDFINCLESSEAFKSHLSEVGRTHSRFRLDGLQPTHWGVFLSCALLTITEAIARPPREKDAIKEAWRQFLTYFVGSVRAGYTERKSTSWSIKRGSMRPPNTN